MTTHLTYDPAEALRHVRTTDPVMAAIIERAGPYAPPYRGEPFAALMRSILYQQLAGKAAAAIERRVLALFGDRYPTPGELAAVDPDALRAAGLSRQKQAAFADMAAKALDGTVAFPGLADLDDDAVVASVTRIRGVGTWTGQMLLIFSLGRPDVLPAGDLAICRGAQLAYGLDEPPSAERLTAIAEPWRPYRTVASWYLWRSLDTIVPA